MDASKFSQLALEAKALIAEVESRYQPSAFQVALQFLLVKEEGMSLTSISHAAALTGYNNSVQVADKVSFEEFAATLPKEVSSHNSRFVAIAYFLERYGDSPTFRANEITDTYYARAHWAKPQNTFDVAKQCAKNGYYESIGTGESGVKLWRITGRGRKFIEGLLQQ
jgi:hypothetical protein